MEGALLVHIFVINVNRHNLGDEHIVSTELFYLSYLTFNSNGALGDVGCSDYVGGHSGKSELRPLIDVATAGNAGIVSRIGQLLGG